MFQYNISVNCCSYIRFFEEIINTLGIMNFTKIHYVQRALRTYTMKS